MREDFTNETKGYHISDGTPWYEPYTDNRKRLFRDCQREYGRCVSSVDVDTPEGPRKVGWYFERKEQYEDTGRYGRPPEYYIRGVWVHLWDAPELPSTEEV
jgi:hypothetical protein